MSNFLRNADPSRSRAMLTSDEDPFYVAVTEVQNLAKKLGQMNDVKQNVNYEDGKNVLEQCATNMTNIYENNVETESRNDENLDDSNLNSSFGRQFIG